jgi:hypothetical protein
MTNKLYLRKEFTRSYLIQRLHKPYKHASMNPFSFGGGLTNGGLSKEAFELLSNIFEFDYMGSAEFEFGAVPAALQFLADQTIAKNIVAAVIDVSPTINRELVYIVCPLTYKAEVIKRIKELRHVGGYGNIQSNIQLKEYCGLKEYFIEKDPRYIIYAKEKVGWVELDNGFIFFTDKEMFDKFCNLFGIDVVEQLVQ